MRKKNVTRIKKDVQRGEGIRLAEGASLLGEGRDPADFLHVATATPLQTKRKELENDQRYRTEAAPDTNKTRERRTTAMRRDKDVKPI